MVAFRDQMWHNPKLDSMCLAKAMMVLLTRPLWQTPEAFCSWVDSLRHIRPGKDQSTLQRLKEFRYVLTLPDHLPLKLPFGTKKTRTYRFVKVLQVSEPSDCVRIFM